MCKNILNEKVKFIITGDSKEIAYQFLFEQSPILNSSVNVTFCKGVIGAGDPIGELNFADYEDERGTATIDYGDVVRIASVLSIKNLADAIDMITLIGIISDKYFHQKIEMDDIYKSSGNNISKIKIYQVNNVTKQAVDVTSKIM